MPAFEVLIPLGPRKNKSLAIEVLEREEWQRHRLEFLATVHPELWPDIQKKIEALSDPEVYDPRFSETVQQALDELSDPDLDPSILYRTAFFYFNESVDVRLAALAHSSLTENLALGLMQSNHVFRDENAAQRIQKEIKTLWENPTALLGLVSDEPDWRNIAQVSVKSMICSKFVEICMSERASLLSYHKWIENRWVKPYVLINATEKLSESSFPINVDFPFSSYSYNGLYESLCLHVDPDRPFAILPYLEAFWPLFTGKAFGYPLPGVDAP